EVRPRVVMHVPAVGAHEHAIRISLTCAGKLRFGPSRSPSHNEAARLSADHVAAGCGHQGSRMCRNKSAVGSDRYVVKLLHRRNTAMPDKAPGISGRLHFVHFNRLPATMIDYIETGRP